MIFFKNRIKLIFLLLLTISVSCKNTIIEEKSPNILWIYLEDTSPLLGCYDNPIVSTPNIDDLAKNGVLYTNAFMPAPVCSASRSSVITGIMATTLGAHNHHSSRTEESAIYLPEYVQTIPEIFKSKGYFSFNNGKDDYNFTYDRTNLYDQDYKVHPLYGKSGERLDLTKLKSKEPFFGQIQMYGGKEIFNSAFKENVENPIDRDLIDLPPYLPNHPTIVEEYANHIDAIHITDRKIGEIMQKLKDSQVLKNTIVFFFSDHGMRLTRHKQFLYDGGIQVPLIIADFRKNKKLGTGVKNTNLVSGLDLGTSSLSLANIPIPKYMEGQNIFDPSAKPRDYVISTRDRCDFTIDRIRSVRTKKFKYIRNFMTDRPYLQQTYMDFDKVPFVKVMKQLAKENKLDDIQATFASKERPSEELYNIEEDPFEINNLANDINHASILKEFAGILDQWIVDTDDKGQYPENEEGLKLMLGIWGEHALNPEYEALRKKYPDLSGSLVGLKSASSKKIKLNK